MLSETVVRLNSALMLEEKLELIWLSTFQKVVLIPAS